MSPLLNRVCLISAVIAVFLTGCSPTPTMVWASYDHVDTTNLYELEHLKQKKVSKDSSGDAVTSIRIQALRETAMALGAQGALALRTNEIDNILNQDKMLLDQVFNFNALLLENDILPPVLTEGRHVLNVNDNDTLRIADHTYTIVEQARFASTPPNWRNYLWLDFEKPDVPSPTLLPKPNNAKEQEAWKQFIDEGWQQGQAQANDIFATQISRLKRDYEGMALYRKLLDENMISSPFVAKSNLGITGGGNNMTVNDQILRITAHPSLNAKGNTWTPAITQQATPEGTGTPDSIAISSLNEVRMAPVDPKNYVK